MSPAMRSGSAAASAAMVRVIARRRISACAPQGAGGTALTTVPGAAVKERGAKMPWLIGSSGSRKALSAITAPAALTASEALTTPATCFEEPEKSMRMASSSTVSARRRSTGSKTPS